MRGVASCEWTSELTLSIGIRIIYVSYVLEVIWTLTTTYVACANSLYIPTYDFTRFDLKTLKAEKGPCGSLVGRSPEGYMLQVKPFLGTPKVPFETMRWLTMWVDGVA